MWVCGYAGMRAGGILWGVREWQPGLPIHGLGIEGKGDLGDLVDRVYLVDLVDQGDSLLSQTATVPAVTVCAPRVLR